MYPYKHYSMGEGMMIYNHDGSIENEIAITVDKMIEGTLLNTDNRLIDILAEHYRNSSIECNDDIQTIINNWLQVNDYRHIHKLLEYYIGVRGSFELY